MSKERIMLLLSPLFLATMISVVNAGGDSTPQQSKTKPTVSFFDEDPFFSSPLSAIAELKKMQENMDRLMQAQIIQMQKNQFHSLSSANLISHDLKNIDIKETNNKLIYTIPKPPGSNSKVNVSLKERLLLIEILTTEEKRNAQAPAQSFQYSQSSYSQSIYLPTAYDPSTIDVTTKEANVIVTFNKGKGGAVGTSQNVA